MENKIITAYAGLDLDGRLVSGSTQQDPSWIDMDLIPLDTSVPFKKYYEFYKLDATGSIVPDTVRLDAQKAALDLANIKANAVAYLNETSWINDKYNDVVLINKTMTHTAYKAKYAAEYAARSEARITINKE